MRSPRSPLLRKLQSAGLDHDDPEAKWLRRMSGALDQRVGLVARRACAKLILAKIGGTERLHAVHSLLADWRSVSPYWLRHGLSHLIDARRIDEAIERVSDLGFLTAGVYRSWASTAWRRSWPMQSNESREADTIFVRLLTAVRSGRRSLREHPSDLPSILPNQLAAQGVDWSEIDSIVHAVSGRPLLRFQRSFDEGVGAVTILPGRQISAAAVRSNHIVAGTADGELLSWPISDTRDARGRRHCSSWTCLGAGVRGVERAASFRRRRWRRPTLARHPDARVEHHYSRAIRVRSRRRSWLAPIESSPAHVMDRSESGIVDSGRELNTFVGHAGPITTLDASPDQSVLVSGATDCTLRVWDLNAGTLRALLRGHRGDITGGALVSSGETFRVLSASADGLLKLWNLDGNELCTLGGHTGAVRALKLVTWLDTPLAVSGGDDGTVWVWDVEKAGERRVFRGHRGPVTSVCAFGDEPSLVLSASDDGTCRLWDLVTGSLRKDYRIGGSPVTALSAAGGGDIAACVTEEGIAGTHRSVGHGRDRAGARPYRVEPTGRSDVRRCGPAPAASANRWRSGRSRGEAGQPGRDTWRRVELERQLLHLASRRWSRCITGRVTANSSTDTTCLRIRARLRSALPAHCS